MLIEEGVAKVTVCVEDMFTYKRENKFYVDILAYWHIGSNFKCPQEVEVEKLEDCVSGRW